MRLPDAGRYVWWLEDPNIVMNERLVPDRTRGTLLPKWPSAGRINWLRNPFRQGNSLALAKERHKEERGKRSRLE
ncbi:MAG: hypothetical protein DMG33_12110 [Acidobacteria bacterium]|nr:MAG: hypothetical protein DMG33_12110 [Acidobacteriota bacterium]